jgi:hypothetical protein
MNEQTTQKISNEISEELDQVFHVEIKQPGDLTITDLMKRYACSDETVRIRMRKLTVRGEWVKIRVVDEKGKSVVVYRKKAE